MATARLVASAYGRSNSTYVSVTDPSYMYTNVDSTTYATLTTTRNSNTTYYVYIRGFNFSSIPSDATVTGFTVKIKASITSLSTASTYYPRLVNNTTEISGTTPSSNFSSTATTLTLPTGSLTWSQITGYGSNFGIRLTLRRPNASTSTQGYIYVYGAEIEVTYTEPSPQTDLPVRVKSNGSWVQAQKIYVKQSGAWSEASGIKAKSGGTWHG